MKLLILFIILNVANVIIQTVKSIATIKCGKTVAAVVNAVAYGLYTVVVVYTVCDLPLWIKVLVVAVANLIGVYVVKWFEEKSRKDKLWAIRFTVKDNEGEKIINELENKDISYGYDVRGKYIIFETFCNSKEETLKVKEIVKRFNAKYFISENKIVF
jgi:uncharacterized protein YebE (UPF0316 family)